MYVMYNVSQPSCVQDKVGPFARSAADAAIVLNAIRGQDPNDPSSFDSHMDDPFSLSIQNLSVGYLPQTPNIVSLPLTPCPPTQTPTPLPTSCACPQTVHVLSAGVLFTAHAAHSA